MSLLGIDLGTTGTKCTAYNEDGKLLGKTYREHALYMPGKGIVELDANLVWENICLNIKELNSFELLNKDPVEALSISVSADEALPVDKQGRSLYKTIMSMDKRGQKENNWINSLIGAERIYQITGQPPSNLYALNRLLWFRENKPEIFKNIYKFLCWEEFIFLRLGVEPVTDYSVACRTLAFDINEKKYSQEILGNIGINADLFPKTVLSGTEIGIVNKEIKKELGFSRNVKVVTGGFDQICASLGCGIIKEGMASVGTGTMEVMHICFKKPSKDQKIMNYGYPFCNHLLDDLYMTMSINSGGGVIFKWYRDNFLHNAIETAGKKKLNLYDIIMDSALKSKYPVMFMPYFEGAQTPRNNPSFTGTILGLTLRTEPEDIIKGMFEGITFDLKLNLKIMEELGVKIDALRATGGGARSDTWLQIKADVTGKLIQKIDVDETGCMAVAVLAGFGIGKFDTIQGVLSNWVKIGKEFEPDMKKFNKYEDKYYQWLKVYDSIKDFKIIH